MDYHNLVKEMVTQWRTVLSSFYIQKFSEGDVHEDKRKNLQTEILAMEYAFPTVIRRFLPFLPGKTLGRKLGNTLQSL